MVSLRPMLEGWLRRGARDLTDSPEAATGADWRAKAVNPPRQPDDAVGALLKQIEETAIAVYKAHGLPVRRGHYVRSPRASRWTFVAEILTPEERWALALTKPANAGWRFAMLEDLGADAASPEVAGAAGLLAGVRRLKASLRDRDPATLRDDMEAAIRLGAEWHTLRRSLDWPARGRLKLLPPVKARGRQA